MEKEGAFDGHLIKSSKDYVVWSPQRGKLGEFDDRFAAKYFCRTLFQHHPQSSQKLFLLRWEDGRWNFEEVFEERS